MTLQFVHCNLCGSKDTDDLSAVKDWASDKSEIFILQKCRNCGLIFLNPRPKKEEMVKYYKKVSFPKDGLVSYKVKQVNFKDKNGEICDVGCGRGFFLKEMQKKGWDVLGIEISSEACKFADEILKIKVFNGEVENANLSNNSFSCITLWHSLEHLPDPSRVLKILYEALKPSGRLVITLPNIESIQARLFKDKWFHIDAPRHLYHFSPSSLTNLLNKIGFKNIETKHFIPVHNTYGWMFSFFIVLNIEFNFLRKNFKSKILDYKYYQFNILRLLLFLPFKIFSFIESFLKKGGTFQITAKK